MVIIGAGIFGATIGITLARQNRSAFLLKRSLKEPDRIVEEFLQPGGVQALETLGLGNYLDGINSIPVRGYKVYYHGQAVTIPYPTNNSSRYTSLPRRPEGRSFHHGRFIRKLREITATV